MSCPATAARVLCGSRVRDLLLTAFSWTAALGADSGNVWQHTRNHSPISASSSRARRRSAGTRPRARIARRRSHPSPYRRLRPARRLAAARRTAPPSRLVRLDSFHQQERRAIIFDRCAQLGIKCEMVESPNRLIAAVGPATAQALAEKGLRVNYVAKESDRRIARPRTSRISRGPPRASASQRSRRRSRAERLARNRRKCHRSDRLSHGRARSARSRDSRPRSGRGSGRRCFRQPLGLSQSPRFHRRGRPESHLPTRVQFVAIGPTTARAMRESGVPRAIEAEEASAAGLADALAKHYRQGQLRLRGTHDVSNPSSAPPAPLGSPARASCARRASRRAASSIRCLRARAAKSARKSAPCRASISNRPIRSSRSAAKSRTSASPP